MSGAYLYLQILCENTRSLIQKASRLEARLSEGINKHLWPSGAHDKQHWSSPLSAFILVSSLHSLSLQFFSPSLHSSPLSSPLFLSSLLLLSSPLPSPSLLSSFSFFLNSLCFWLFIWRWNLLIYSWVSCGIKTRKLDSRQNFTKIQLCYHKNNLASHPHV